MHAIGRVAGGVLAAAALAALLFATSPASALPILDAPTLSATPANGKVFLSWTTTGALSYEYRAKEDDGGSWAEWSSLAYVENYNRRKTVNDLTNGTAYTFQVRGYRLVYDFETGKFVPQHSEPSNSVTETPTASE